MICTSLRGQCTASWEGCRIRVRTWDGVAGHFGSEELLRGLGASQAFCSEATRGRCAACAAYVRNAEASPLVDGVVAV